MIASHNFGKKKWIFVLRISASYHIPKVCYFLPARTSLASLFHLLYQQGGNNCRTAAHSVFFSIAPFSDSLELYIKIKRTAVVETLKTSSTCTNNHAINFSEIPPTPPLLMVDVNVGCEAADPYLHDFMHLVCCHAIR